MANECSESSILDMPLACYDVVHLVGPVFENEESQSSFF